MARSPASFGVPQSRWTCSSSTVRLSFKTIHPTQYVSRGKSVRSMLLLMLLRCCQSELDRTAKVASSLPLFRCSCCLGRYKHRPSLFIVLDEENRTQIACQALVLHERAENFGFILESIVKMREAHPQARKFKHTPTCTVYRRQAKKRTADMIPRGFSHYRVSEITFPANQNGNILQLTDVT